MVVAVVSGGDLFAPFGVCAHVFGVRLSNDLGLFQSLLLLLACCCPGYALFALVVSSWFVVLLLSFLNGMLTAAFGSTKFNG